MTVRVVVIGGGISGLAVAHRLTELSRQRQLSLSVTLLEASDRFGGVIETQRAHGFLLESGPDAFLAEKPWAEALCRRLGLAEELIDTQPAHRRSFLVANGRLVPVPSGWYLVAPARLAALWQAPMLSWSGKLRIALEPLIPPRRDRADESVASFLRRRFGREALIRIGQPMVGGIYTADVEQLSLRAALPALAEMERTHGSVLRGLRARTSNGATAEASGPRYRLFVTLRGGLQTLVDALIQRMPEVALRSRARVTHLAAGPAWTIALQDGQSLQAEAVCLALPADRAAALLGSISPSAAKELAAIPYESVATVNLAFRRADVPHALDGFGLVVPAVERRGIVGCTFSSVKFSGRAPEGSVLLRAFVGGALHRAMVELDDAGMQRMVRRELRELLGIEAEPQFSSVRRFPRAMPQYHVGHLSRVEAAEAKLRRYPTLFLTGNGYRGIGIPDCIAQAESAAQRMFDQLAAGASHGR